MRFWIARFGAGGGGVAPALGALPVMHARPTAFVVGDVAAASPVAGSGEKPESVVLP